MRCSTCNFENAAGKKFCIRCGSAFILHCPKCGCENPHEASFCGDCGASLATGATAGGRRKDVRKGTFVHMGPGPRLLGVEGLAGVGAGGGPARFLLSVFEPGVGARRTEHS